ncbi:MAG: histidine phosphatase family protein [Nocardioides sp.]|uniref:histidine phosphatase family protein n=1 Tax=Nocardioides sp. TaxID=35761 RepID=UPI0039E57FBB
MRRLILLRHGVTEWNLARRFQGHADTPLSPRGHEQAAAAARDLAGLRPARLWSSDQARARETAEHVSRSTGLPVVVDQRLREIHVGDFQGITHDEARARYGAGPWDYAVHGGESDADVAIRAVAALRDVAATLADGETGVVVTHGHSIRVALVGFLGWPPATVSTLGPMENCGWVELNDLPASWSESAPWRLAAYNRVAPIS